MITIEIYYWYEYVERQPTCLPSLYPLKMKADLEMLARKCEDERLHSKCLVMFKKCVTESQLIIVSPKSLEKMPSRLSIVYASTDHAKAPPVASTTCPITRELAINLLARDCCFALTVHPATII